MAKGYKVEAPLGQNHLLHFGISIKNDFGGFFTMCTYCQAYVIPFPSSSGDDGCHASSEVHTKKDLYKHETNALQLERLHLTPL